MHAHNVEDTLMQLQVSRFISPCPVGPTTPGEVHFLSSVHSRALDQYINKSNLVAHRSGYRAD